MNYTNYFCIVDLSGSMSPHLDNLKKSVLSINKYIKDDDTITLGYFSGYNEYEWICKGSKIKELNLINLINNKFKPIGLTCYNQILENIKNIVNDLELTTGNKNSSLFFLTDGYPNDHHKNEKTIKICKKLKKIFNTILICGFGKYYNREFLLEMCNNCNAQINHIDEYDNIENSFNNFFKMNKTHTIFLSEKYNIIWQITDDDIFLLNQEDDLSVKVYNNNDNIFYYNDQLLSENPDYIYSLVYILSILNNQKKAIEILRSVNAIEDANNLRKSFTVAQKGRIENIFKQKAIFKSEINKQYINTMIDINDFIIDLYDNLGNYYINLSKSNYKKITRNTLPNHKIKFTKLNDPRIVNIVLNENKANLSLQTITECDITDINDENLMNKIIQYNKNNQTYNIIFPLKTVMYKNYTLISNGDFNFEKLCINDKIIYPPHEINIFNDNNIKIKLENFINLSKQYIEYKTQKSVINMYLNKYKKIKDFRVEYYGEEGKKILEEIGIDSKFRFNPKKDKALKSKDFITFTKIETYFKGCSTINIKKCYEKFLNSKKIKLNKGDLITFPLFEKYEKLLKCSSNDEFINILNNDLISIDKNILLLKNKLCNIKFYMISTNYWFEEIEKKDKIEIDDLIIKVSEEKYYL